MTRAEAEQIIAATPDRTHVFVTEDGDEFVTEWDGVELRAGNIFGLDSLLTFAGCPAPRNLYCVDPKEKNHE